MVDYVKMQALAKKLVEANGRTVTLQRISRNVDDPSKPWRATPNVGGVNVQDEVTLKAVMMDTISSRYLGLTIQTDGQETGDAIYYLVATTSAPGKDLRAMDRLVDGNQAYQVSLVNVLRPGDEEIFVAFVANERELIA